MSVTLNGHLYQASDFVGADGRGHAKINPDTGLPFFPDSVFSDMIAELSSAASVDGVPPGAAGSVLISDGSGWVADQTPTFTGLVTFLNNVDIGDGSSAPVLNLNGAAGSVRDLRWRTGGSLRWIARVTNAAESGADAGSDWTLHAYTDGGLFIDTPITIARKAGGVMTLPRPVTFTSTAPITLSSVRPNIYFKETDAVTSWWELVGNSEQFVINEANTSGAFQRSPLIIHSGGDIRLTGNVGLNGELAGAGGWATRTTSLLANGSVRSNGDLTVMGATLRRSATAANTGTNAINENWKTDETTPEWVWAQRGRSHATEPGRLMLYHYDGVTINSMWAAWPTGKYQITASDFEVTGLATFISDLALTSHIRKTINDGVLVIAGGNGTGQGANIELYGGTHASLASYALIDAARVDFRSQNGGTTRAVIGSGGVQGKMLDWGGVVYHGYVAGLVGNGTTDDRANLATADTNAAAAGAELHLGSGTYLINSNITISSPLAFSKGAKLKLALNVVVTIENGVRAGLWQIFDCSAAGSKVVFATYNDVEANPIWWGADRGPFASDTTVAFQKWALCEATRYYIPWGQYLISGTIDFPSARRVRIRGTGIASIIYWNPSADGIALFKAPSADNWKLEDFALHVNTPRLNVDGMDFTPAAAADVTALELDHIYFSGFTRYGLKIDSVQHLIIRRCRFNEITAYSAATLWTTVPAEAIRSTTWLNRATIELTRFWKNDKDMRIVQPTSVTVRECSFEEGGFNIANGVAVVHGVESSDGGTSFSFLNNYVEGNRTATNRGWFRVDNMISVHFKENVCDGSLGGIEYTDYFVEFNGTNKAMVVSENRFMNPKVGYIVESAGRRVQAHDNAYGEADVYLTTHNAVMALMSGTRIEINSPQHKETINPPLIATGGFWESADIAMTGIGLGDKLETAMDVSQQGLQFDAYVKAAGIARLTLKNDTGVGVDLLSTDVRIWRHCIEI